MTTGDKVRLSPKEKRSFSSKILIPLGPELDKPKMISALDALSSFKEPLLVLFHVIELPSRTVPLDQAIQESDFKETEEKHVLQVAKWLREQGYNVQTKVAVARSVADGVIEEANNGEYNAVLLLKRRLKQGFLRRHKSVSEKVSRYVECPVITQLIGEKGETK
jgi:nucleotide-binding universal stress UspA family protein